MSMLVKRYKTLALAVLLVSWLAVATGCSQVPRPASSGKPVGPSSSTTQSAEQAVPTGWQEGVTASHHRLAFPQGWVLSGTIFSSQLFDQRGATAITTAGRDTSQGNEGFAASAVRRLRARGYAVGGPSAASIWGIPGLVVVGSRQGGTVILFVHSQGTILAERPVRYSPTSAQIVEIVRVLRSMQFEGELPAPAAK